MDEIFRKQVFEIIRLIPPGRMTTYGSIAKAVGYPNHARHVGNALRNYDESFPAHRVCGAGGHITAGCFDDFKVKLNNEGVELIGTKV